MTEEDKTLLRLSAIERQIRDFKEKFEAGTADADNFISIGEIERLWGELQDNTNIIYSEMVREMMSSVDETALVRKKKESSRRRG